MRLITTMVFFSLLVSGCGRKVNGSETEKAMSSIEASLDRGHYESAIPKLEALNLKHPGNAQIQTKLLHAYAGAGTFEAIKVIDIWKEVQELLKKYKEEVKGKADKSIKAEVQSMFDQLENVLSPIPDLTPTQKKRLNQAINLYHELGLEVETAGKYNNFKWGTLHVYRLAITVKAMVQEARSLEVSSDKFDVKGAEAIVLPKLKTMGQDLFMAYKLFGNSFDKIKKITASMDKLIAKTVNDPDFKLKISTDAKDEAQFYTSLIRDNIHVSTILLNKAIAIYQENSKSEVDQLIKAALPSGEQIASTGRRIEALVRVFLESITNDTQNIEAKLRSIFNEELKDQVMAALKDSLKAKSLTPLKELLDSKSQEVEILRNCYEVLRNDVEISSVPDEIKAEVNDLRSMVDLVLLKQESKAIALSLQKDLLIVQLGLESMVYKDQAEMEKHQQQVDQKIQWLEKYLHPLVDGLKKDIDSTNPDEQKMDRIIQETKTLVES